MFYLHKDEIRLVPVVTHTNSMLFDYEDIRYLAESRLMENLEGNTLRFIIEWKGTQAGEISLHSIKWFNRKAMITLFVYPEYQGKGLGHNALQMLIEFSFQVMNLYRLEAEIVEGNEASLRLIEKSGFHKEGTLRQAKYLQGRYYDIYVYGLLREEWKNFNIY